MTPLEQSIVELSKKIKYGEIVLKIEDYKIVDVIELHKHKPKDLIEENAEMLLTSLARNDKI